MNLKINKEREGGHPSVYLAKETILPLYKVMAEFKKLYLAISHFFYPLMAKYSFLNSAISG
jgi:hypothetical protein